MNPFGVTVNKNNISGASTNVDTAADNPLINGPMQPVSGLKFYNGATLGIDPAGNPNVRAAVWSGTSRSNSNVMAAYGSFGAGRFAVVGDSSPADDGTGSPGNSLYADWAEAGVNPWRLMLNASVWLAAAKDGNLPYNDGFSRALRLEVSGGAQGTNVGATKEPGEPDHAGQAGGASVWWSFTAFVDGTARISTEGSDFDTLLAVYSGNSLPSLVPIVSNDNVDDLRTHSVVEFPVRSGETYSFAVDGVGGNTGRIALAVTLPRPANDLFANATPVVFGGANVTWQSNSFNAGKEPGEPEHAGYEGGRSVWWRWTAAVSGPVTVSTVGSDFDTLLAIYTGDAVAELERVAKNANFGGLLQSQTTFAAVAGTTYSIAVDGYAAAAGNIVLALAPAIPPANDNLANATVISGVSGSGSVITHTATREPGEPDYHAHSIWWRWTVPAEGVVTLTTAGSDFDTILGVYQGVYRGGVLSDWSEVATDDDGGSNGTSKLVLGVEAGTRLYIAIDGFDGATGTAVFNLSLVPGLLPRPVNDSFGQAAVIGGSTASATGKNLYARQEAGETAVHGGGHSVWWRWTAPADLIATVSTAGSDFDTTLDVSTGPTVDALVLVGSNDDFTDSASRVSFAARAGVTYQIRVDGYSNRTGNVVLALTSRPVPLVSLATAVAEASEKGPVSGTFTLTLDSQCEIPLAIQLSLGGQARAGVDYAVSQGNGDGVNVLINAGLTSAIFTIKPLPDSDPTEGEEQVIVTLVADPGYRINPLTSAASVVIRDDSPYRGAWLLDHREAGFSGSAAAPSGDPDSDGVCNLLEFAFNSDPLAADAGSDHFTVAANLQETPSPFLTVSFVRRTDAPNLHYAVEASDGLDPSGWDAAGAIFVWASTDGMQAGTERVTYRITRPMSGPAAPTRQFLRLRVSSSQP